jgi:Carboxypeptidase regulatory-like domain
MPVLYGSRLVLLFCMVAVFSSVASAQKMSITGTVQDTALQKGLPYAVVVVAKLKDSLLTSFARTDMEGHFKIDSVPVDTYQVVVSHPLFGDHTILLMGNPDEKEINLHNISLPPRSFQLNEVTVYGYADPVYYKGDTLFYTADSFQVKKNGVVEDLLKKLPGIKVDAQGKIYSQGKVVDQVLVDGDEFFGSDPTVATRNLSAASVESVAVYEKANENASDNSDKDVLKVMDLKLKDDAKKGYFGKLSTAHDYKDFYEDEILLNKFMGKQKLSVFLLGSNTPRTSFGWNDMYEYGLMNDEMNYTEYDDGSTQYYYDNNPQGGIPRTFKTGAYFTDMLTQSTKVSLNYSYKKKQMDLQSSTASQYFLPDTAYKTTESRDYHQETASHTANILINQKLDSLNELEITSKFVYSIPEQGNLENNAFYTDDDTLTRTTFTRNETSGNRTESNSALKWTRTFSNRDRKLTGQYRFNFSENENDGILQSINRYYNNASVPDDSINQEKNNNGDNHAQYFSLIYP